MSNPNFNVHNIAALARIALTDQEESLFQIQLEQILERVKQLKTVDVSHVQLTAHAAPVYNIFRKDEPKDGLSKSAALANAPCSANGFFLVTKAVE